MAKTITVQARLGDQPVYDRTIAGKGRMRELQLEAMAAAPGGLMRSQTVGAKGWAVYEIAADGRSAVFMPRHPWGASAG